jgi:hypothetical protein
MERCMLSKEQQQTMKDLCDYSIIHYLDVIKTRRDLQYLQSFSIKFWQVIDFFRKFLALSNIFFFLSFDKENI